MDSRSRARGVLSHLPVSILGSYLLLLCFPRVLFALLERERLGVDDLFGRDFEMHSLEERVLNSRSETRR